MTFENKRLEIDPNIGDILCQVIEGQNPGTDVHVILVALPQTNGGNSVGRPTFVSSLSVEDFKRVMIELGTNYLPNATDPDIQGVYDVPPRGDA